MSKRFQLLVIGNEILRGRQMSPPLQLRRVQQCACSGKRGCHRFRRAIEPQFTFKMQLGQAGNRYRRKTRF